MKNNENKELGMGWHDFMVFCRGFTGVVGIIGAIVLAILSVLAFKPIGIMFSLVTLVMAMYSFEIRRGLEDFEKGAPKKLITYSILSMIVDIADVFSPLLMSPLGSGNFPEDGVRSILISVIRAIVMIIINSIYYKKREDMFVN